MSKHIRQQIHTQKVRAKKQGVISTLTVNEWLEILKDSQEKCHYCKHYIGSDLLTIDHIMPMSKGGANSKENIVAACLACNIRKSDLAKMKTYSGICDFCGREGNHAYITAQDIRAKLTSCVHCWKEYAILRPDYQFELRLVLGEFKGIPLTQETIWTKFGNTCLTSGELAELRVARYKTKLENQISLRAVTPGGS